MAGAEQIAVLGLADHLRRRADDFDVEFFEHPHVVQFHGHVERGLASQRGQAGVRTFHFDDFRHRVGGDRFDIGAVREFGVGHDGGGVAVHQNQFVTFFPNALHAWVPE